MPLVTVKDLGRPPGVCSECWNGQHHHRYDDSKENYYCAHHQSWAIPNADFTGWIVITGVTQDEFVSKINQAARLFESQSTCAGPKH